MKLFISYSRTPDDEIEWTKEFAKKLKSENYEVDFDQSNNEENIGHFIENGIRECDIVLCVCTDSYINKVKNRNRGGGVAFETNILTQFFLDGNPKKL